MEIDVRKKTIQSRIDAPPRPHPMRFVYLDGKHVGYIGQPGTFVQVVRPVELSRMQVDEILDHIEQLDGMRPRGLVANSRLDGKDPNTKKGWWPF